MPKIIIQTDQGTTIDSHDFPMTSMYAMYLWPSCPQHTGVHALLMWTKRTLKDAEAAQVAEMREEQS